MKTSRKLFLAAIVIVLLLCAACAPTDAAQDSSIAESPAETAGQTPAERQRETSGPTADTGDRSGDSTGIPGPGVPGSDATGIPEPGDSGQQDTGSPTAPLSPSPSPPPTTPLSPSPTTPVSPPPTAPPSPSPSPPVTPTPTPSPSTSPTPTPTPSPSDSGDNVSPSPQNRQVVLTITGNGVEGETTWTLDELQALVDGYQENIYSTTNNWPNFGHAEAHGVSLPYLLSQAGVRSGASGIKFISTDGYNTTLTYNQVFRPLYSYSNHNAAASSGASRVEPVVAWVWGDVGKTRQENIRLYIGQSSHWEVNTMSFVTDLCRIEVSTVSAGSWAVPSASVTDGSEVPSGTEFAFTHDAIDNIRIYYTVDGSEPDVNSRVYNPSTSYFQPHLTVPLVLTESVTIKAFAAGLGREASPVVTFDITVT